MVDQSSLPSFPGRVQASRIPQLAGGRRNLLSLPSSLQHQTAPSMTQCPSSDLLCCPVSQDPYKPAGPRRPRILPCGHSVSHVSLASVRFHCSLSAKTRHHTLFDGTSLPSSPGFCWQGHAASARSFTVLALVGCDERHTLHVHTGRALSDTQNHMTLGLPFRWCLVLDL